MPGRSSTSFGAAIARPESFRVRRRAERLYQQLDNLVFFQGDSSGLVRAVVDEIGYDGWIGCEYNPLGDTVAGLSWRTRYGV